MADRKISEGTEILGNDVDLSNDLLPIVDVSDLTDSGSGTTKKIKPIEVKKALALDNVDNTSDANKPISNATQSALNGKSNTGHTHTKSEVGLSNVDNTSDINKPISTATQTALDNKADLVAGKVPASQLPSYVDDVLEYANLASFPVIGEADKIYVAIDTNLTYRWTGSVYATLSPSLALGETNLTAYRGDRGKIAYDHSQTTGNPHGTTASDIGAISFKKALAISMLQL